MKICKNDGCGNEVKRKWGKECNTCYSLKARYNITMAERNAMYTDQSGKCKICDTPVGFSEEDKPAVVDHCHETGKVRGILCSGCNTALGKFKDNVELLKRAINYIKEV